MTDMMIQDPPTELVDDLRAEDETSESSMPSESQAIIEDAPSTDALAVAEDTTDEDAPSTDALAVAEDTTEEDAPSTDESETVTEAVASTDEAEEDAPIDEEVVAVEASSTSETTGNDEVEKSFAEPTLPTNNPPQVVEKTVHPSATEAISEPKREPIQEPVAQAVSAPDIPEKTVAATSNDSEEYNPTLALRLFNLCRVGFVRVFDIVLTGVAIIVENLAALDWAGYAETIISAVGYIHRIIIERVPHKIRLGLYASVVLLLIAIPTLFVAMPIITKPSPLQSAQQGQTIPISQQQMSIPQNDILAPFFTPTVQQWANDIERWTINTDFSPNQLAVVMQLSSCGNATVGGGLFGIAEGITTPSEADAHAQIALNQLQSAMRISNGDFPMALAVYVDGEIVMTAPFSTWSLQARDMFILGRIMLRQADQNAVSSPDLNTWLQNTGLILCTQGQSTRNN